MMRRHILFPIILISLFIIIGNSYAQTPTKDTQSPTVTNCSPPHKSMQVPLNNLISLNITDAGTGVDADLVTIEVNNNIVYTGGTSPDGNCRRLGMKHDYTFVYQSNEMFDYEQTVVIKITAKDFAGNELSYTYYIMTEMRSFGKNIKVNSDTGTLLQNNPSTARDSAGNIWVVWDQTTAAGYTDIYIGKLSAEGSAFEESMPVFNGANNQRNPAIAIDSDDMIHVAWEGDDPDGYWDIFVSTLKDGTVWSNPVKVFDGDPDNESDQTSPAIAIDGDGKAYIAWEDNRKGNKDICVAISTDGTKWTSKPVTIDEKDQTEPTIAIGVENTEYVAYIAWTDARNANATGTDIYGAKSTSWNDNVEVVNTDSNQSSPVIAAEATGTILHLLWVDDTDPKGSIFYASTTDGLQGLSPIDPNVVDEDERVYMQKEPTIAVTGSTGNNLKVFACWQDWRNVNSTNTNDTDLYFTELSSGSGTNIFVSDEGTNSYQGEPAIGINKYGFPYLVWSDGRNTNTDIYYAGSTFVDPTPLWTEIVSYKNPKNAIYGVPEGHLRNPGDISIKVPPRAFPCDVIINVSRIKNTQRFTNRECKGQYEFGPSGIKFSVPITITIAYEPLGAPVEVYWYDPLIDELRQDGITNVTHIEKDTVHLVRFKTRHFTPFYLFEGSAAAAGGGGGGGGCSISPYGQGSIIEFLLPYTAIVIVLLAIRWVDARRKKKLRREL